jgi:hypothetical protein
MGIHLDWNESRRLLTLALAEGSRMLPPASRALTLKLMAQEKNISFSGKPVTVQF